jgi:hypothetical protein
MFGEQRMMKSFDTHPPDYILFVDRKTDEYGARLFGRDYGQALCRWVEQHYQRLAQWGGSPLTGESDGSLLMHIR